jgi:hypothetical protein
LFLFAGWHGENPVSGMELLRCAVLVPPYRRPKAMLVERGLQVMNVGAVGDAYAIAANYLRRTGAIPDSFVTNEALVQIIVQLFHSGEFNKIRLANMAIAKFEAQQAA